MRRKLSAAGRRNLLKHLSKQVGPAGPPPAKERRPTPHPPDRVEPPVQNRSDRSHVNEAGHPKKAMTAFEATEMAHRHSMTAYLCSEKPEHYHIGKGREKGG